MKICNCFFVAALAAALLTGCGSSPSKNDIERAVTAYVGMARSEIGDVKLDDFKILNEEKKKVEDADVCFRQFEAHYTVTCKGNPSKHSFAGTVAMLKQGQKWIIKKELCTLTFVYSPPILDAATQAAMDRQAKINANDPNFSEEPNQKIREQPAKESTHQQ
jgi:hypothetical protein